MVFVKKRNIMKKILYSITLLFTAMAVITACSTTRNASTTSSLGRGKITGTWVVNTITYDGISENSVQNLFDQGTPDVFQGSTWALTNSGKGVYVLNNGTSQSIFWGLNNTGAEPEFTFKKINEGEKAKNVDAGYKLVVGSADGDNLTLKAPVQYNGSTAYIVFNMTKK
jgi:hypothetical protein